MNFSKLALKTTQIALGIFVFGVVVLLFLGHYGLVNVVKPYVVQSGSMEPAIKTGSVIFSFPSKSYNQGDIITFTPSGSSKNLVTHRIEAKLYSDSPAKDPIYLTSGDANEDFDRWEVKNEQIVGKVALTIPYLGYLVDFAKKPQGFILLVIVPATIVIYEELKNLLKETKKEFEKLVLRRTITESAPPKNLPKISMVVPAIGASLVLITFTASYFLDKEKSTNNLFGASSSFEVSPTSTSSPTPTPTTAPSPTATQSGTLKSLPITYLISNK